MVEVLSPSTEEYDRGVKREHYQQVPSLRDYVLVAQCRQRVEVFSRAADNTWRHRVYGSGELVELPSLDCRFELDELYTAAGLSFHTT